MRKVIVGIFSVFMLAACSTSKLTSEQKTVKHALVTQKVRQAVDGRAYTVEMNYIYPQCMASRHLDYGYTLRISGDSIYSYLPYFGRAYSVPYNGGNGLNFKGVMDYYKVTRTKKDCTDVVLGVKDDGDEYQYTMNIYDNGTVSLGVFSRNRESISFSGEMMMKEN